MSDLKALCNRWLEQVGTLRSGLIALRVPALVLPSNVTFYPNFLNLLI